MNIKCRMTKLVFLSLLFSVTAVASEPERLWFNSGMNNRDVTFSPDGTVMLTTIVAPKNLTAVIAISHKTDEGWSALEVAPFSGQYADIEPAFAPDGKSLMFASKRPKPDREGNDWDLWQVSFADGKWGEPYNPGQPVNTEGAEYYPSLTIDGALYFTATRPDTVGVEDLYVARLIDGGYPVVENIGEPVNSKAYEFNAFIAPDESYLIFGSQGRDGETGGGDLYISYRRAGVFSEPVLLGPQINTGRLDYAPTVFDGYLYFTSERSEAADISTIEKMVLRYDSAGNGFGDVYRIKADVLP